MMIAKFLKNTTNNNNNQTCTHQSLTHIYCLNFLPPISLLFIINQTRLFSLTFFFLGNYAFYLCSSLTQITLTSGLTVIGGWMFDMNTGTTSNPTLLGTVTIPSSVTSIGEGLLLLLLLLFQSSLFLLLKCYKLYYLIIVVVIFVLKYNQYNLLCHYYFIILIIYYYYYYFENSHLQWLINYYHCNYYFITLLQIIVFYLIIFPIFVIFIIITIFSFR